jgi:hypothetical protein
MVSTPAMSRPCRKRHPEGLTWLSLVSSPFDIRLGDLPHTDVSWTSVTEP